MIVVSDTTAVSNLLTVGRAELLPQLFERVLAPPAVFSELLAWHENLPTWLEVMTVTDQLRVERYAAFVHPGEAEAIALALETEADWLLLDDSDGRRLAKAEGAPVLGLMGVLLLAKRRGVLANVRPLMDRLRDEAGFYLSDKVRREIIRLADEEI
ncbi:MAG: DUF3368 domain-containing protein [Verrucomicrobiaceae bacterium]